MPYAISKLSVYQKVNTVTNINTWKKQTSNRMLIVSKIFNKIVLMYPWVFLNLRHLSIMYEQFESIQRRKLKFDN